MKCIRFVLPALAAAVIIGAAFASCSKDKGNKETPSTTVMEYVDLGLPSGLKWAKRNLGALKPSDYGDYYAWGETEPKSDYSLAKYNWSKEGNMDKYNASDGKTALAPEDDAAAKKLGSPWRMPTADEIQELLDNCDWAWTEQDGKSGYEVRGNGNSIFLPAAGGRFNSELCDIGNLGYYWSSSLDTSDSDDARSLIFDSGVHGRGDASRCVGLSVRPVRP